MNYAAANSMELQLKMTPFNSHISFKHAIFSLLEIEILDSCQWTHFSIFSILPSRKKGLPTQQKTHMKNSCLKTVYYLWRVLKNIKVQIVPASIKNIKFTFLVILLASCECCLFLLPNTQAKVAAKYSIFIHLNL